MIHRLAVLIILLQVGTMYGCSEERLPEDEISSVGRPLIGTADSVVAGKLNFLDSVVAGHSNNGSGYPLIRIQTAIEFMEDLTGIQSISDGTYIGRMAPDVQDLLRWREWLNRYGDCLEIDNTETIVYDIIFIDSLCE